MLRTLQSQEPGTEKLALLSSMAEGSIGKFEWSITWRLIPERTGSTKSSTDSEKVKRKNVRHMHDDSISKVCPKVTKEYPALAIEEPDAGYPIAAQGAALR